MHVPEAKDWHFDVDRWINPFIPPNVTYILPGPIARFLGHRDRPRREIGNVLVAAWALLGAFVGVIVIEAVFMIPAIRNHGPPLLIASFGAAAILEYNTIESPLAQPRNSVLGHFLAALTGVCVTKLFALNPDFENLRWIAGGLACGLASAVMTLSKTTYPPAGATALLAAVDPTVQRLGWYLLPLILLSSAITLVVSLLINNIQRRYPTYWWTPATLRKGKQGHDIEKLSTSNSTSLEKVPSNTEEESVALTIEITTEHIVIPDHFYLAGEERAILEILRNRLAMGKSGSPDHATDA